MIVFLAGGDQGVPRVVNAVFERGGENPIAVGLFDGNDNKVIPLANAEIFQHDIRNFGLFAYRDFRQFGVGRQNSGKPLGAFNTRFDLDIFFSRITGEIVGAVLLLIVARSGIFRVRFRAIIRPIRLYPSMIS